MDPKAALFERRHQNIAERSGSWYPDDFQAEVYEALAGRVARVASPPGRLIEFGCGTGENVREFASAGWEAAGVDVSRTAIRAAQVRAEGLQEYFCANLSEPLAIEIAPATVVLDGHCYHFQLGEQRSIFLENVKRCLQPGGWLIVNSLIDEPKGGSAEFDSATRILKTDGVETSYYASLSEIESELRCAGFDILDHEVASGEATIGIIWARLAEGNLTRYLSPISS